MLTRSIPLFLIGAVVIGAGVLAVVSGRDTPPVEGGDRIVSDLIHRLSRSTLDFDQLVIVEKDHQIYAGYACNHRQEDIPRGTPSRSFIAADGSLVVENGEEGFRDTSALCNERLLEVQDPNSLRQMHKDKWPLRYDPPYFIDDSNTVYYADFPINTQERPAFSFHIVPGADAETFIVDDSAQFAKDAHAVYINGRVVNGADPATLRCARTSVVCAYTSADSFLLQDKHGVYGSATTTPAGTWRLVLVAAVYPDGLPAPALDGATFVADGNDLKDKQTRYVRAGKGFQAAFVAIYPSDTASFHFLNVAYPPHDGWDAGHNDCTSPYAIDSRHVYCSMHFISADPKSFKLLDEYAAPSSAKWECVLHYARDSQAVYFDGEKLSGADPESFHPIPFPDQKGGREQYGTDGRTVYYGATPLVGADPKTFQILWYQVYEGCGAGEYAKDATHVYFKSMPVPGADAASFTALRETDGRFGKDARGYYDGTTFIGKAVDPSKLECSYG